ncbi:MAG TPA: hypothetical protein DD648_07985, partial [Candidatus Omnitrophica bacterium]|nr:hypothetical protein [Candidatus Omnitrophota bacterium]
MSKRPTNVDLLIAAVFIALITFQPYFLHGRINLFELGIYLPGINAVLDGLVPYRDIFHLRGPLELYVPALLMKFLGESIGVLEAYFYIGTVIALIVCVFIAKELYQTRFVLYLMVPVLAGRTFPRVVFTFWGGMRFAFGLVAVLLVIYFFKRRKIIWLFAAGLASSLAFLTSVDIGACSILSIGATFGFAWFLKLEERGALWKSFSVYGAGLLTILVPYGIYLYAVGALIPYIDAVYSIVVIMTKIFPDSLFENHPSSVAEAILAMGPWSPHFKHLTPAYCYLFSFFYVGLRIKKRSLSATDLSFVCVFFYGLILYILVFRKLGSSVFEMALQPEKIVLFFLLEAVFLTLLEKKKLFKDQLLSKAFIEKKYLRTKIFFINFVFCAFIGSSLGYAAQRYNNRFFFPKYMRNLLTQKK